jgi:hypothetical protein
MPVSTVLRRWENFVLVHFRKTTVCSVYLSLEIHLQIQCGTQSLTWSWNHTFLQLSVRFSWDIVQYFHMSTSI